MSDIYLIRHGFTPANNASYNGQKGLYEIASDENMPLDIEYGRKQAEEIGEFLNKLDGKILVYSSPHRRVQETLDIALSKVNFDYELRICNDLKEINSGVHYAKTKEELLSMHPEAKEVLDNLSIDYFNTRYLNGESQMDVKKRVEKIALKIKKEWLTNKYNHILVFAHGTVNRWLSFWISGVFIDHILKNGEIIKITNDNATTAFIPTSYAPIGYEVDIEKHKKLLK